MTMFGALAHFRKMVMVCIHQRAYHEPQALLQPISMAGMVESLLTQEHS
jgi:hypothetical protein